MSEAVEPESLLSLDETTRLIIEAVIVSDPFYQKLSYWMKRNKPPSQKWLMQELIEALGKDRIALVLGRAVDSKQESC